MPQDRPLWGRKLGCLSTNPHPSWIEHLCGALLSWPEHLGHTCHRGVSCWVEKHWAPAPRLLFRSRYCVTAATTAVN